MDVRFRKNLIVSIPQGHHAVPRQGLISYICQLAASLCSCWRGVSLISVLSENICAFPLSRISRHQTVPTRKESVTSYAQQVFMKETGSHPFLSSFLISSHCLVLGVILIGKRPFPSCSVSSASKAQVNVYSLYLTFYFMVKKRVK